MGTFIILILFVAFVSNSMKSKPLTTEQKLEDFDYLYNTLLEHQPMLEEYQKVIGFDFKGNKEYYQELIRNTKDDYEYLVMLDMILGDFPSVHTGLFIEEYSVVKADFHRKSKELNGLNRISERSEYWQEYISRYYKEKEKGGTAFVYHDGHYISNDCYIAYNTNQTVELLEIDGVPIDEYIKRREVNGKLAYDVQHNKVFRSVVALSLSHGQPVYAAFKNSKGESFGGNVYIRTKDYAFDVGDTQPIQTPDVEPYIIPSVEVSDIEYLEAGNSVKVAMDEKRNVSYIYIWDFKQVGGQEIADVVRKASENDNIIIDLRMNEGGVVESFLDNVYPWLFVENTVNRISFYTKESTIKDKICSSAKAKKRWEKTYNTYSSEDNNELVKCEKDFVGDGKSNANKKIYILISHTSVSAADFVANMLKHHETVTLIGTSTAGEGIADTYCVDVMPNSHITFRFQHSQAFNSDGTDNSVYGTMPDIYMGHSFESIAKRNQLMHEEGNYKDYENRLMWDNILIETLEIIENRANGSIPK